MAGGRFNSLSVADQCLVTNMAAEIAPLMGPKNPAVQGLEGTVQERVQELLAQPDQLMQLKAETKKHPAFGAEARARCGPI